MEMTILYISVTLIYILLACLDGEDVLSGNFIKRKGCYYSNLNHICCFKVI